MTTKDFQHIALSFLQAVEFAHMDHPDFRVRGEIFATLGYPDENRATVKVTAEEQKKLVRTDRNVFLPVRGACGRRGNTNVYLPIAKIEIVREALAMAWRNTSPKRLTKMSDSVWRRWDLCPPRHRRSPAAAGRRRLSSSFASLSPGGSCHALPSVNCGAHIDVIGIEGPFAGNSVTVRTTWCADLPIDC
jgi:hypothetical protein